jgi:hypothetical protein
VFGRFAPEPEIIAALGFPTRGRSCYCEPMVNVTLARGLIEQLDAWVNDLAAPLLPPQMVAEGDDLVRVEFRRHNPHTVMIGKSIRAVSGLQAALVLADLGYVAECAALLRMVSDLCTEVTVIGKALNAGGELPAAVRIFIEQYFVRKAVTPEQFAAEERIRYVSRGELLKAEALLAGGASVGGEQVQGLRRFLNMAYDAYVHGAYETAMELYSPPTGRFMMSGHPDVAKREEFAEAVFLKLHEVVIALEFTAAVTGHTAIFKAAREARHTVDSSDPWQRPSSGPP